MRRYTIVGENLTLSTGNVLVAVQTAGNKATAGGEIEIRRVEISQSGSTTSAQIRGALSTRNTAGTLTVTAATPKPINPLNGPASGIAGNASPAGAAARSGVNSSADTGGTYDDLRPFAFNNLSGYLWVPTPEERIVVPPSVLFVVRLLAAPGTLTGWTVAVDYEELG